MTQPLGLGAPLLVLAGDSLTTHCIGAQPGFMMTVNLPACFVFVENRGDGESIRIVSG